MCHSDLPGGKGGIKRNQMLGSRSVVCFVRPLSTITSGDTGWRRRNNRILFFFFGGLRYGSNQQNYSAVTHFILLGIPNTEGRHTILFVVFLTFYLSTLLGNTMIMMAVVSDFHLHTPMYFFLCKLAVLDIGFSSVNTPKMLALLWVQSRTISLGGCMAQVFFYHFVGCSECLLYTVMAYDRYVAICYPLRYLVIMNRKVCVALAIGISVTSSIQGIVLTSLTFTLPYCGPNQVDYFFCDILPVIKLACADTTAVEALILNNVGVVGMTCFFLILLSYVRIIYSVARMSTREGRRKAASTCASHLLVVTFFFGPCALVYTQPSLSEILLTPVHIFGIIVTPMLNPAIYTLRNKEVKAALKKLMGTKLRALLTSE